MKYKQIEYANIYKNISFGLYGYDDIEFNQSKENILEGFMREYESTIKEKLESLGLKLHALKYYSPHAYNYESDDITTIINITDKIKLKKHIIQNKDRINNVLSENKSYDGYISLTVNNVKEELENLSKEKYEPDIIVLTELLNINCESFDIHEYMIFEPDEEQPCRNT